VDVRLGMMRLRPRDRFLLCTDGLHGPVPRDDLITLLDSNPDPAACCDLLVARANECGGPDNITAVVADVAEPGPPQAWRFGHVRHEATALLPRLFRPWMLGAAAAGLGAALLLWAVIALVPRTESHSGPTLSSRIAALAAEARTEANAGHREAAREALKDLVREAVRSKARFEPGDLRLGDAAEEFDAAANAIWTELYARVGEKLAELSGTPAARYVDGELNATLARIQTIHDQFHTGDYTKVDATFAVLPKQVEELVERGKADFEAERGRIVQDIERLRAKSKEFGAGNPVRAALEDHVAEAARALGLGDLAKARREVDLARKELSGGAEP